MIIHNAQLMAFVMTLMRPASPVAVHAPATSIPDALSAPLFKNDQPHPTVQTFCAETEDIATVPMMPKIAVVSVMINVFFIV